MAGSILSRTFELLTKHWQAFIGVALLVGAISATVQLIYGLFATNVIEDADSIEDLSSLLWVSLLGLVVSLVVALVVNSVLVVMARNADRDEAPNPGDSLQHVLSRFGVLIAVALLSGIAVFIGLLLFIIPGIWIGVSLVPVIAVVMFEDRGIIDSMRRSFSLVSGSWWQVFGVVIVLAVINFVLGLFTAVPGPIGFLVAVIVTAITLTIQAFAIYVTYDELRAKSDAVDTF
ncbi:MAG: hypothetical protein QNJ71_09420 [Acidimicrobiia bacterium]|nr:hypothetical protein [Acidimicrobiia bacterium]